MEAETITGVAKAVLEFAHEAALHASSAPRVELSVLTFLRGQTGNVFTRTVSEEGLPLETIPEKGRFDLGVIRQLRAAFDRVHPHVLWTNAVKSHFLVRLAGLHRRAGWVAFHHGYTASARREAIYHQLDRWNLPAADLVVTVCRPFAAQVRSRGVPEERIRVQHMAVRPGPEVSPAAAADLRQRLGLDSAARILLTVGRLSREKAHSDLLRALAILKNRRGASPVRLVVVGAGPELCRLEDLSRQLGLSASVLFVGQQAHLRLFYALADVFVLPSHSEGSPNVLLEAMEAGVPVAATAVGGVPEIATHERDALLVPPADPAALANAIERLLFDASLAACLTQAAREVVLRHAPERFFRAMLSIFEEVSTL